MATLARSPDQCDLEKLDSYDYGGLDEREQVALEQIPRFRRFLWFCSGSDAHVLARCPRSEWVKQEGIGGIVLATAVLAFLSGSFAIYSVNVGLNTDDATFSDFLMAVLVGVTWSLIIFNLDRFVVSSTGHGDGRETISPMELLLSLPRLGMALVIGLSISAPLEIWVMKSEISGKLLEIHEKNVKGIMGEYDSGKEVYIENNKKDDEEKAAKIAELDNTIKKFDAEIGKQLDVINAEGSNPLRPGIGERYKAAVAEKEDLKSRQDAARVERQKEQLKLDDIRSKRAELESARREKEADAKKKEEGNDGLILRTKIAHETFPRESFVLTALLVVIEIAPILFKLMMPRGPYLDLLENQEKLVIARFGIVEKKETSSGWLSRGQTVVVDHDFHQPRAVERSVVEQLSAESRLRSATVEKFTEQQLGEIDKDPSRFVASPPSPKA